MVKISVHYQGELHCRAVHEPSESALATDAPVSLEVLFAEPFDEAVGDIQW